MTATPTIWKQKFTVNFRGTQGDQFQPQIIELGQRTGNRLADTLTGNSGVSVIHGGHDNGALGGKAAGDAMIGGGHHGDRRVSRHPRCPKPSRRIKIRRHWFSCSSGILRLKRFDFRRADVALIFNM